MQITRNRRAWFDYEIIDTMEAGVELSGAEVKSLRAGKGSLSEAYARVVGGELLLLGANISKCAREEGRWPRAALFPPSLSSSFLLLLWGRGESHCRRDSFINEAHPLLCHPPRKGTKRRGRTTSTSRPETAGC